MNKNISVWRGNKLPPTDYHLWIKSDGSIYLKLEDVWREILFKDFTKEYKALSDTVNKLSIQKDFSVATEKEVDLLLLEELKWPTKN